MPYNIPEKDHEFCFTLGSLKFKIVANSSKKIEILAYFNVRKGYLIFYDRNSCLFCSLCCTISRLF